MTRVRDIESLGAPTIMKSRDDYTRDPFPWESVTGYRWPRERWYDDKYAPRREQFFVGQPGACVFP